MNTLRNALFAGLAAATLFSTANSADAAGAAGLWYDHTGRAAARACAAGSCG